jgi:hypothetical protein
MAKCPFLVIWPIFTSTSLIYISGMGGSGLAKNFSLIAASLALAAFSRSLCFLARSAFTKPLNFENTF